MTTQPSNAGPRRVDTLISGATIITLDAQRHIITDGALAISADRIVAVGKREYLQREFQANTVIDGRRFVLTPGFVNAHIHVTGDPLTRGYVPDDLDSSLESHLMQWVIPRYLAHSEEDECLSAQLAALEMLRSGTTCFLEAGTIRHLDAVVEGLLVMGVRGRVGAWTEGRAHGPGEDQTALTDAAIRTLQDEVARYPARGDARIAAWPILIGHSTNTDEVWKAAKSLADTHGLGLSAHMSPFDSDPRWYLQHTGRRPIEHLAQLGVLGSNLCLTHAVQVDEHEVQLLAESGTHVVHCPLASLKGAFGVTSVGRFPEMAALGMNIALGTDGYECDQMHSMRLVSAAFKDARRDTRIFPAPEALMMGTLNGASALGLEHEIGALAPGKKADVVMHDTDRPEWQPLLNVVNQLIWSADGRGVHSVWVDGVRVVDNYHSTMVDESELYRRAQSAGAAIVIRSGIPAVFPWPTI